MRFCIIDDDQTIIQMLSNIIKDRDLGNVVGKATDGQQAIEVIIDCKPDVVLIDYLMPMRDGVAVQHEVAENKLNTRFVMITQVSDKMMIADAYSAGVEFVITKPINVVEVERVLHSVIEKINMERTLTNIRGMLGAASESLETCGNSTQNDHVRLMRIRQMLSHIGLVGEKGCYDILNVCEYVFQNHVN